MSTFIEDVEYLQHDDGSLMARVVRPTGAGPFPAVVELHGGAWCVGDRLGNEVIAHALAERGVVVASLDFRSPPGGEYPASVADVNYGVRWLKAHAADLGSTADRVGAMGSSSGGHLALLNALKPHDARYASIRTAGNDFDASVPYVVSLWPVVCPAQRHAYLQARGPSAPDLGYPAAELLAFEDSYWGTPDAMAEGSPLLALERDDPVELPDVLCVQGEADQLHPLPLLERFVESYRRRGGRVDLELFGTDRYDEPRANPSSAESTRIFDRIATFVHARAASAVRP